MTTATRRRRERVKVDVTYLGGDFPGLDDEGTLREYLPDEMDLAEVVDACTIEVLVPAPDPTRPDWIAFLHWMADLTSRPGEIVDIVEKPWHWSSDYAEYLIAREEE